MSNSCQPLGQVGQARSPRPPKRCGELLAALQRAVGDGDATSGCCAAKCVAAELDHLAGADEQHALVGEVVERCAAPGAPRRRPCDRMARRSRWCVRTSLATANERWNSWCSVVPSVPAASAARTASFIWPRICGSPSTIESRPQATRKAWRTACVAAAACTGAGAARRRRAGGSRPGNGRWRRAVARGVAGRSRARCGCRSTGSPLRRRLLVDAGKPAARRSAPPGRAGQARSASCSRSETGAVVWLRPTASSCMWGRMGA